MDTYVTCQGDTWDTIAKSVYGDELKADALLKERSNIELIDYQVFPSGVTVFTPEMTDEASEDDDLPEWRKD